MILHFLVIHSAFLQDAGPRAYSLSQLSSLSRLRNITLNGLRSPVADTVSELEEVRETLRHKHPLLEWVKIIGEGASAAELILFTE